MVQKFLSRAFSTIGLSLRSSVRRGLLFSALALVNPLVFAKGPAPADASVPIFEFRHPETHERIVISMANIQPEVLRQYRPSQIRSAFVARAQKPRVGIAGMMATLAHEYPAEWTAFSLAIGLSAKSQMQNDPAALKHFIEQSITDPVAHLAFAGFLMGSKASTSFLAATGLAYDPYRAPIGDYQIDHRRGIHRSQIHQIPGPPTHLQRKFAPLVGPMGLGVGMTVSSVITEMLNDPNLALCAKSMISVSVDAKAAAVACDTSWADWAVSKKLMDYAPDVFSMMSSALIQAYMVNAPLMKASGLVSQAVTKGSERSISVLMRGLTVAWRVGSVYAGGPVVRFAVAVGNVYVFMEIHEFLLPYLKKPWERRRQGLDITSDILKLTAAFQTQQPLTVAESATSEATSLGCGQSMEVDTMGNYVGPAQKLQCAAVEPLNVQLKKFGEKQKKWRQFILSEAFSAHSNWQDYVSRFSTLYANAYSFYSDVVNNIHWQRTEPAKSKAKPALLFQTAPLSGIFSDPETKNLKSAVTAVGRTLQFGVSYLKDSRNFASAFDRQARAEFEFILRSLSALNPDFSLAQHWPESQFYVDRLQRAGTSDTRQIEAKVRGEIFETGLRKLRQILSHDRRWTDHGTPFPGPAYEGLARGNPFAKLRILLGDPSPRPAGVAYILEFNDDPAQISQASKKNHPSNWGRIKTQSMTEYLLAAMVCGPDLQNASGAAGLVHEVFGFSASFRPPRIVSDLPADLCQQLPLQHNRDHVLVDPHTARYQIDGQIYEGFLDIVRQKASSAVVGTQPRPQTIFPDWKSQFDQWWSVQVDPQVTKTLEKFRSDFKTILSEKYIPAMKRDEQVIYNGISFQLGALASLESELDLYLGWLEKSLASSSGLNIGLRQQIQNYRAAFTELSGSMTDLGWVDDTDKLANENYKIAQDKITTARQSLVQQIQLQSQALSPSTKAGIEQITKNLQALSGELDSYYGILRTLKLPGH